MSKRRRRIGSCLRKVRQPYFDHASRELLRMKQKLGSADFLQIYHCRLCRGWHIGNAISVEKAMKSLKTLEDMMDRDGFRRLAPPHVKTKLHWKRLHLIRYLLQRD